MRVEGEQEPAWGKAERGLEGSGDEGTREVLFNVECGASITLKMRAEVWRPLLAEHRCASCPLGLAVVCSRWCCSVSPDAQSQPTAYGAPRQFVSPSNVRERRTGSLRWQREKRPPNSYHG